MAAVCLAAACLIGGCKSVQDFFKTDRTRFFDPTATITAPERSPVHPILQTASSVDRHEEMLANATRPTEADLQYTDKDYVIGPTDLLEIQVLDLFAEGVEANLRREVETSGYISLPMLPTLIKAEGRTQEELRQAISAAYSPGILLNPVVSVSVIQRRQSMFSILGSVGGPGPYTLPRKDTRLLEALALARGLTRANVSTIYVIRPAPAKRVAAGEAGPAEEVGPAAPGQVPELPAIPELPATTQPALPTVPSTAPEPATAPTTRGELDQALEELRQALPGGPPGQPAPSQMARFSQFGSEPAGRVSTAPAGESRAGRWAYVGGRWVRVGEELPPAPAAAGPAQPLPRESRDPFDWKRIGMSDQVRIIAISIEGLQRGEPRMNIIVRDNDIIYVPVAQEGEFFVMGEVSRPGAYSLTGRQVTLKMALATAGNLGQLSWPKNSTLTRRVGDAQEQIIPLDVEAILRGEEPDLFLRPNDVIAVGTDARAPFYAVMRNAFRISYGFGFIYDRNFASAAPVGLDSKRFQRW